MFENLKIKIKEKLGVPLISNSLKLAQKNGFKPKVVYEIGAYEGTWTKDIIKIFSTSSFYMFEAQQAKEDVLNQIKNNYPTQINYHIGLLGAITGKEVVFNEYETVSSVHEEYFDTGAKQKKSFVQTLDNVVEHINWPLPDLIKLDTQGYEIEILKGGSRALQAAEAVLIEVSFLEIYKGAPLFQEVVSQMSVWEFQVYDICSLMRRPFDKALFQSDILFIRKNSKLLTSKRWA